MRARGCLNALLLLASLTVVGCEPLHGRPPLRQVAGGDADRGRTALRRYGCAGCHSIPGLQEARSMVGPPLEAYGQRAFVAGVISNNAENLVQWLIDPRSINPLTAMPNLGVGEEEARDMAAYLYRRTGD